MYLQPVNKLFAQIIDDPREDFLTNAQIARPDPGLGFVKGLLNLPQEFLPQGLSLDCQIDQFLPPVLLMVRAHDQFASFHPVDQTGDASLVLARASRQFLLALAVLSPQTVQNAPLFTRDIVARAFKMVVQTVGHSTARAADNIAEGLLEIIGSGFHKGNLVACATIEGYTRG